MPDHIDNRLLVAYAMDMVDDENTLSHIEEHLLICEDCRNVVTLADRHARSDPEQISRVTSS